MIDTPNYDGDNHSDVQQISDFLEPGNTWSYVQIPPLFTSWASLVHTLDSLHCP